MSDPADFTAWKAARLATLTAQDGWLNLTDRLEISPGPQRVGSAPDNDMILSRGPAHLGRLLPGFAFESGGETRAFVARGGNPMLEVPPFLLEIHTVEGQPALRVRDLTLKPAIALGYFPHDPAWVKRARWERLADPQAKSVDQRGAGPVEVQLTHRAHFAHEGREITLLATHWKGERPMFVFRDATSGRETYGANRFLYGEDAEGGEITLDFNHAFNPPCAFTDLAICPLPPPENRLNFAIRAGELAP